MAILREQSLDGPRGRGLSATWPWLLPLGSAIALTVGNGPISVFAFGVFIKPLEAEFGWSRASISAGLSLCGLFSALALPVQRKAPWPTSRASPATSIPGVAWRSGSP